MTFSRQHFHPLHCLFVIIITFLFLLQLLFVHSFRFLDRIFFSDYRKIVIRRPILITGNPRSGTTFLHRLLSTNRTFTSTKLFHTIFPSISLYFLIDLIASIDRRLCHVIACIVRRVERNAFNGWEGIHHTRLDDYEEDETLFVYRLLSPVVGLLFPYTDYTYVPSYVDRLHAHVRDALMSYYRDCLQRHMYACGSRFVQMSKTRARENGVVIDVGGSSSSSDGGIGGSGVNKNLFVRSEEDNDEETVLLPQKTMLIKNTTNAGRLQSTLNAFPDMAVVHVVRHPYDCIPSLLSMYDASWSILVPQTQCFQSVKKSNEDDEIIVTNTTASTYGTNENDSVSVIDIDSDIDKEIVDHINNTVIEYQNGKYKKNRPNTNTKNSLATDIGTIHNNNNNNSNNRNNKPMYLKDTSDIKDDNNHDNNKVNSNDINSDNNNECYRMLASLYCDYYRARMHTLTGVTERSRVLEITYEQLVSDPYRSIVSICERFAIDMSECDRRALIEQIDRSRRYKSEHVYSLERFGLTKRFIYERMPDVFEHYGFRV